MKHISLLKLLEAALNFEDAGEDADNLGLVHKGFGNYYDAQDNYVAKSVDGQLVKVGDQNQDQPPTQSAPAPSSDRDDWKNDMAALRKKMGMPDPKPVSQQFVDKQLKKVKGQSSTPTKSTWTRPDGSTSTNRPPSKLHPSAHMPVHPDFKKAAAGLDAQRNADQSEFDRPYSYEIPDDEPMPSMTSMVPGGDEFADVEPDYDNANDAIPGFDAATLGAHKYMQDKFGKDWQYDKSLADTWKKVKAAADKRAQDYEISRAEDEYDRNPGLYGESSEPAKGKKWKTNGVSHGEKGARIAPGTAKGDAYCARSNKIKGDWRDDPNSPNNLSRKKWKCRGDKSMKD